jgi:2',3'-cyclic-nucleotide 2'-phosphodiesterase (5'-nucleotidase family)
MARWASLIDLRRTERPAILVDSGDFCYPRARRHAEFEDDFFFEGMRLMRYAAAGIGSNEIRYGRERLLERASEADLVLLGTNIIDKRGDGTLGRKWTIVQAGGRRSLFGREGGVRVGIFSVTLPHFVYGVDPLAQKYYEVIEPRLAALEAVSRLREKNCDLIVAISNQGWDKSVAFAEQVPGIDIVINGRRSHPSAFGEMHGGALVVDTGPHRTTLAEVSVVWRGGVPSATVVDRGGEALRMPERPDLKELQDRYERESKERGIKID